MYIAAVTFVDLQDGRWLYHAGDIFPHDGLTVSEERLAELAGSDNLSRRPLITAVPDPETEPAVKKTAEKKPVKKPVEKKPTQRKRGTKSAE